jgi:hypothetical protein
MGYVCRRCDSYRDRNGVLTDKLKVSPRTPGSMETLQTYMYRRYDSYRERNGAVPDGATGAILGAPLGSDCAEQSPHRTAN